MRVPLALRRQLRKNQLACLFLAQGTPQLLAGDEPGERPGPSDSPGEPDDGGGALRHPPQSGARAVDPSDGPRHGLSTPDTGEPTCEPPRLAVSSPPGRRQRRKPDEDRCGRNPA